MFQVSVIHVYRRITCSSLSVDRYLLNTYNLPSIQNCSFAHQTYRIVYVSKFRFYSKYLKNINSNYSAEKEVRDVAVSIAIIMIYSCFDPYNNIRVHTYIYLYNNRIRFELPFVGAYQQLIVLDKILFDSLDYVLQFVRSLGAYLAATIIVLLQQYLPITIVLVQQSQIEMVQTYL